LFDDPRPLIDIVAFAGSAGGIEAISEILLRLPTVPAAVIVVQHLGSFDSELPTILGRSSSMPTEFARNGALPLPGHIYIAPPRRHLRISRSVQFEVTDGPKVTYSRPSADALLVSLALHAPLRTVGIILSGANGDGANGAWALRQAGGIVIAQDEATSRFPEMPRSAAQFGAVDFMMPLSQIPLAIETLTTRPAVADVFRRDVEFATATIH
jgi:two-component system chemotaxis response regulator CheB